MLVNQSIPLYYRHMIKNIPDDVFYGENEYEFNEVLLLKKVAAFFVVLATTREPEDGADLLKVC